MYTLLSTYIHGLYNNGVSLKMIKTIQNSGKNDTVYTYYTNCNQKNGHWKKNETCKKIYSTMI